MKLGIIYLLTGNQLAARLAVSIFSLRRFYDGPITIFTTRPESEWVGNLLAADDRLRVNCAKLNERPASGHASSYLTKPLAAAASPYDATVFLDADTLIVGDISELLHAAESQSLTVTAYCDWTTAHEVVAARIHPWAGVNSILAQEIRLAELVATALALPLPAINTGVFAVPRGHSVLPVWDALASAGVDLPLPDEIALQLLLPRYEHRLLGGHYNCHPFATDIPDVRIYHFAGGAHLAHKLSTDLWMPVYRECVAINLAQIRRWSRIEPWEPDSI